MVLGAFGHRGRKHRWLIFKWNARLLGELAKEERLYQSENNKYLLVANPKTPPFVVAKHIGYLRGDSLNKLVCSHECNRFAHDYATRLLEKRGRFRAGPDQGA